MNRKWPFSGITREQAEFFNGYIVVATCSQWNVESNSYDVILTYRDEAGHYRNRLYPKIPELIDFNKTFDPDYGWFSVSSIVKEVLEEI